MVYLRYDQIHVRVSDPTVLQELFPVSAFAARQLHQDP